MPNRLFIFISDPEADSFEVAAFEEGKAPSFSQRTLEKLPQLITTETSGVIVVLTGGQISEHAVKLPSLKFAEKTIPHALEDRLISPIESLHFAYSNKAEFNEHYLVKVIDQELLTTLLKKLKDHAITPTFLCNANANEHGFCYLTKRQAYFNEVSCLGAVPVSLFKHSLNAHPHSEFRCFSDSNEELINQLNAHKELKRAHFKIPYLEYFCISFSAEKNINLLQGQFEPKKEIVKQQRLLKLAGISFAGSIILAITIFFVQMTILSHQLGALNKRIATIYFKLFPQASAIVSPKFRVGQLLKDRKLVGQGPTGFLGLLEKTAPALYKSNGTKVLNLNYQNNTITASLSLSSFRTLNTLIATLKGKGLNVSQKAANTVGNQINATIEVQNP